MDTAREFGRGAAGQSRVEQLLERRVEERTRELTALLEVSRSLTSTLELAPLLDLILDQLLRVVDYRTAGIFLARADALETMASRDTRGDSRRRWSPGHRRPLAQLGTIWQRLLHGEPLLIDDVRRDDDPLVDAWRTATSSFRPDLLSHPVRTWLAVPLSVRGQVVGYLALTREVPDSFTAHDTELAVAFAGHAAVAIDNARLYAESRQMAALEERARLARDLHDSVTQSVFSVGLMTNAALGHYVRGLPIEDTLRRIKAVSQDALAEMRALLYELHPAALAAEGLTKALAKLVTAMQVRVDVPITFTGETERRLAPDIETAVFRIVQEALGNAAKYAQATDLRVTLAETEAQLSVTVADNGVGFDPAAPVTASADGRSGGMGLRSMRSRAAAAGLGLQIESAPGAGTRVTVTAPLPEPAPP